MIRLKDEYEIMKYIEQAKEGFIQLTLKQFLLHAHSQFKARIGFTVAELKESGSIIDELYVIEDKDTLWDIEQLGKKSRYHIQQFSEGHFTNIKYEGCEITFETDNGSKLMIISDRLFHNCFEIYGTGMTMLDKYTCKLGLI